MPAVHRLAIQVGVVFPAPTSVTFNWQESRQEFSVWFVSGSKDDSKYIVLGTGHEHSEPFEVVDTIVLPDGFHAFHLCRLL